MTLLRLALLTLVAGTLSAAPPYKFSVNGEPVDPHLYPVKGSRLGAPTAGDIGTIAKIPFVLQRPGTYRFRSEGDPVSKLFCKIDDGPEECVGIFIGIDTRPIPEIQAVGILPRDPLADLTPAQRNRLWGVRISYLPTDWAKSTEGIDWSKTAMRLDLLPLLNALKSTGENSAPPLSSKLRYLTIRDARPGPTHFPKIALPDLLFLDLESNNMTTDLGYLKGSASLCNLSIKGGTVVDSNSLSANNKLRFLKLRSLQGLDSLGFAHELPELRVLKVDETDVTDPSPLAGLNELRLFSANGTNLSVLPPLETLPALRDLRLHSTPVAKNQKEAIAALRPRMNVLVKNWDPAIKAFEEQDAKKPPPESPVLFIGSSSIRQWKLSGSFPGVPTLNRGFGGSELSDSLRYFDRIVLPYRPRAILLYAGDNDMNQGETLDQVVGDYKKFAAKVRAQLPKTHFAFLPIKPSLKRWELWPRMKEANEAIRKLTESDDHLHYLDTPTPMFGEDGTPMKHLFVDDGLHLSEAGYKIWTKVVAQWLKSSAGL